LLKKKSLRMAGFGLINTKIEGSLAVDGLIRETATHTAASQKFKIH